MVKRIERLARNSLRSEFPLSSWQGVRMQDAHSFIAESLTDRRPLVIAGVRGRETGRLGHPSLRDPSHRIGSSAESKPGRCGDERKRVRRAKERRDTSTQPGQLTTVNHLVRSRSLGLPGSTRAPSPLHTFFPPPCPGISVGTHPSTRRLGFRPREVCPIFFYCGRAKGSNLTRPRGGDQTLDET